MVKKINLYDWSQERMLVITDAGIYNVYKKKIKRKIEIKEIGGVDLIAIGKFCQKLSEIS